MGEGGAEGALQPLQAPGRGSERGRESQVTPGPRAQGPFGKIGARVARGHRPAGPRSARRPLRLLRPSGNPASQLPARR